MPLANLRRQYILAFRFQEFFHIGNGLPFLLFSYRQSLSDIRSRATFSSIPGSSSLVSLLVSRSFYFLRFCISLNTIHKL